MRVLWLLACLSISLISPAESNLRAASPMMGDGVPRTGPAGPKGDTGDAGVQGDKGDPGIGVPGAKGDAGAAGAKGDPGPPGVQGQRGADGAKGDQGNPGPAGAVGQAGAKGETGATGARGADGIPGPQGVQGPAGIQGAAGSNGLPGATGPQGLKGDTGAPKRVERYTATSSASLTAPVATFTWPACTSTPDVDIIPTWSGNQMIVGGVTAQTLSGATVAVKRSKGTLLLTDGPFEPAPSTPVTIRVICN